MSEARASTGTKRSASELDAARSPVGRVRRFGSFFGTRQDPSRQALHWVLKVGDRGKTVALLRDLLGMQVLRHEEFEEGCAAACNGPYDGRWSKTMIGYGGEREHFVLELTYNYPIKFYARGNDLAHIELARPAAYRACAERVQRDGEAACRSDGWLVAHRARSGSQAAHYVVRLPDGYVLHVCDAKPAHDHANCVTAVALNVSNLSTSVDYWSGLLDMDVASYDVEDGRAELRYGAAQDGQCRLVLLQLPVPPGDRRHVQHADAAGRIAFTTHNVLAVQAMIDEALASASQAASVSALDVANAATAVHPHDDDGAAADASAGAAAQQRLQHGIMKRRVALDTPGKATVEVVILEDPDGYEICFVGDDAFWELAAVDPRAEALLNEAMSKDKSATYHMYVRAAAAARAAADGSSAAAASSSSSAAAAASSSAAAAAAATSDSHA